MLPNHSPNPQDLWGPRPTHPTKLPKDGAADVTAHSLLAHLLRMYKLDRATISGGTAVPITHSSLADLLRCWADDDAA